MLILIGKYIEIKIDKYLFEAIDSDNLIKTSIHTTNILLQINCFSDLDLRIMNIINKIIFSELQIDDPENHNKLIEIFDIMKNKAIDKIKTYKSNLAFQTTRKKIKKLIIKDIILLDELSTDDINNISIDDFEQFIHKFNSLFLITVIIHGSTSIAHINKIYESIDYNLNKNNSNINNIIINKKILNQKEIKDNTFINYYYINNYLDETNHVTIINYQMRLNNNDNSNLNIENENEYNYLKINIYNTLYSKCIGNFFFTKLRTEKQLGYIVSDKFLYIKYDTFYYSIIVQGTKKYPDEVELEINEILFESININCNNNFELLKNSLLFEINSNENNLNERTKFFKEEILNMKYNFNKKKKKIEIINNIKDYDEIIKYIKFNFIEKPRRIGIFNYANITKEKDVKRRIENAKIINNLNNYYIKNKVIYTDNIKLLFNNNI